MTAGHGVRFRALATLVERGVADCAQVQQLDAVAWRETTDDGPVSQPELEWKVVTGLATVPSYQPWQVTPVDQDPGMPLPLGFDLENP